MPTQYFIRERENWIGLYRKWSHSFNINIKLHDQPKPKHRKCKIPVRSV